MANDNLRQRKGTAPVPPGTTTTTATSEEAVDEHPAGEVQHGKATQYLRLVLFVTYFLGCCVSYVLVRSPSSSHHSLTSAVSP